MKVVYVAGPFSGKTSWEVECNIRRAEALGLAVAYAGAAPMIPRTNTRFFNGELTYEFWIAATLALLAKCDAIIMTPDWQRSSGARGEHAYAEAHGLPIFYDVESLTAWLAMHKAIAEGNAAA
jgi:hypothetical protein